MGTQWHGLPCMDAAAAPPCSARSWSHSVASGQPPLGAFAACGCRPHALRVPLATAAPQDGRLPAGCLEVLLLPAHLPVLPGPGEPPDLTLSMVLALGRLPVCAPARRACPASGRHFGGMSSNWCPFPPPAVHLLRPVPRVCHAQPGGPHAGCPGHRDGCRARSARRGAIWRPHALVLTTAGQPLHLCCPSCPAASRPAAVGLCQPAVEHLCGLHGALPRHARGEAGRGDRTVQGCLLQQALR